MNEASKTERQEVSAKLKECESLSLSHLLKADSKRYGGWASAIFYLGFWLVVSYRLSHWMYKHKLDFLARLIHVFARIFTGCEISRKAIIGPGLGIYHPMGILIGPHAVMGVCIFIGPNTYIGGVHRFDDENDYPLILDRVSISAGSIIMGGIIIHERSTIGPNTVVLSDVPADSTVLPPHPRVIKRFARSARHEAE